MVKTVIKKKKQIELIIDSSYNYDKMVYRNYE